VRFARLDRDVFRFDCRHVFWAYTGRIGPKYNAVDTKNIVAAITKGCKSV
jgi:hypothetical protein